MKKSMYVLIGSLMALGLIVFQSNPNPAIYTGHGNPELLSALYDNWKQHYEKQGRPEILRVGLAHSRSFSKIETTAFGKAALNLANGEFEIKVNGLPQDRSYDVWLLDHHTKAPETKAAIPIGQLSTDNSIQRLKTALNREALSGFTLDAIAVTVAGQTPEQGGVLFGSPGMLQRVYYTQRQWPVAAIASRDDIGATPQNVAELAFAFLLPKAAVAAQNNKSDKTSQQQLAALIARGQQLFTEETFGGNGRTCSTCHRPDNNHTIDPAYIAKLPKNDPLFVAEYNPKLAALEKPALMRQFGLFLANIDGFDKPGVMRSSSHLMGLSHSLKFETAAMKGEFPEDDDYFQTHNPIAQMDDRETQAIGWSGDGAPDGGSLRDFARGAVVQHMPKTMARVEGADFRLPNEDELDALEAYMLSLGRSDELNLAAMTFKSALVEKGKLLFNTKENPIVNGQPVMGTTGNCNGCHMNAGAISSTTGGNPTRDTGVERMRDQLHHLVDPSVAYDGGFGQVEQHDCGPDANQTCFSDGSIAPRGERQGERLTRFNTPSLVEAADTAPFFHNHTVSTLEESVAFYNTDAFNQSPSAFTSSGKNRMIKLDSSQVVAIAMFLRTINALENIRSSNQLDGKAIVLRGKASDDMVKLAIADTRDAVRVLSEAAINPYPEALEKLKEALGLEQTAAERFTFGRSRQKMLERAMSLKTEAKAMMVSGG